MKILIIGNIRRQQGGITTQIFELRDSLEKEGFKVSVISTHGSPKERAASLFKAYRESSVCDVILGVGCAYYGVLPMLVSSVVSKLSAKPVVYNFHDGQVDDFLKKYHGLLRIFFEKKPVAVATEFLQNSFEKYGFNPIVISNHFNNITLKERKRKNGITKVIWARSFEKLYRPDIALEGAKKILDRCEAEFHFYGGGSLREHYISVYEDVPGIYFHDFVKRERLLEEYGNYDVFINTSDYDNFPMSIVEAGMNGLQVLTSDAAGISSIYSESEVSFFRKGSLEDFVEELEALILSPDVYEYKTGNLAAKISGFNWESVRIKWICLLGGNGSSDSRRNSI